MLTWKCLPLFVPALLCGCASGFDRDALRERLNDGAIQADAAIAEARSRRPQLQFPCRVAVYLKPSGDHHWRWSPEDKAAMEKWAAALKQEGIASDVFTLPEILAGKGETKELRIAAAQCGADVLFVIHGASQTDSYKNFSAALNVTVVGGFIVPGSHKDSLFMLEGILLDVDNCFVYTAVQTEGVGKIVRPTFVIEERDSIAKAKASAVAQFGDEVLKRMRALASAPKAPDRVGRIIIEGENPADTPIISNLDLRPGIPSVLPTPTLPGMNQNTTPTPQNAGGVMTGITAPRPNP